ncbi:MAG: polysaccharide deacetylase family protein [Bacteroidia bacterium]|nr:MAG: polysaccharide deacetylase family protein [Bacteroidia bacterium]
MYFPKTPKWIKLLYRNYIWSIKTSKKVLYLTFDDGPHPAITQWVLNILDQYNAKASFFCIGDNVNKFPEMYQQVIVKGHAVGNHTYNHLNGWKHTKKVYVKNAMQAAELIDSNLFRPPYGRIKCSQAKALRKLDRQYKICMWDVISYDYDKNISADQCAEMVIQNARNGSIIVFHDSEKAFPNLQIALPKVMEHFSKLGYTFERL